MKISTDRCGNQHKIQNSLGVGICLGRTSFDGGFSAQKHLTLVIGAWFIRIRISLWHKKNNQKSTIKP